MPKADVSSLNGVINQEKITAGVRMILEGLGEDLEREGLRGTAERVARMYIELLQGMHEDPREYLRVVFDEQHDEMVVVRDVPFSSLCEHHLLPFHGRVHAAYIPQGKVVGLSKIPRVIEAFARRLQVQERMTSQIADLLMEELDAQGVGGDDVVVHALPGVQDLFLLQTATPHRFLEIRKRRLVTAHLLCGDDHAELYP